MTSDQFEPTFGSRLRRLRLESRLSQEALAERAGLSRRGISDLERGLNLMPRADTVDRLAHALGLAGPARDAFTAAARARRPLALMRQYGNDDAEFSPSRGNQRPPLVGREAELAMMAALLAHPGPPFLLFRGEPGIGKSRLLAEASARAVAGGWQVLRGGCRRRSIQEPYEPIVSVLSGYIAGQRPARVRSHLRGAQWLVRLLPELTGRIAVLGPQWTMGPGQERRLMFAAVGRFLDNITNSSANALANDAGALLVLDDLQWMGQDALDLLGVLLRQERRRPLRVVGAFRETEVRPQDPLASFVADAAREGLLTQRHVGPLREADSHEVLASLLAGFDGGDAALRERIVRRSGGVPLFLVSCARGLEAGALDGSGDAEDEIPWDLRQNIRQRVVALPGPAQRLLEVAAIAGREASVALLMAAVAEPEEELLAALEVADRARLLVEARGLGYRFAHDVIREVVEADMGAARRRMLHRRLAEALERADPDIGVERIAYHYAQAGESAKAVVYFEQAGDLALTRYAFAEAEQVYRETLAHFEGLSQLAGAGRIREKLGNLLATTARNDQALEVLAPAIEQYQARGDAEGAMRSAAAAGWNYAFIGRADEGLALVRSALERAPNDSPSRGLVELLLSLQQLAWVRARGATQVAATTQALEAARALGDDALLERVKGHHGISLALTGRLDEAIELLEAALPHLENAADAYRSGEVGMYLGVAHMFQGQCDRARWWFAYALEVAERIGHPAAITGGRYELGLLAFYTGDWSQARRLLQSAYDMAAALPDPTLRAAALTTPAAGLGLLAFATGDNVAAQEHLLQALEIARRGLPYLLIEVIEGYIAEWELITGKPAAARQRLQATLDEEEARSSVDAIELLALLAWAHLDLGDTSAASAALEEALPRAREAGHNLALLDALRVQAMLAIRQQEWDGARQALDEALTLARQLPHPYAELKVLYVYGQLYAARSDPESARESYDAALAICARLGERAYAAHIERALAALPLVSVSEK